MKKIFAAIIMMILAVTMLVPCYAENINWVKDLSVAELTNKLISVPTWTCGMVPEFCEEYMVPILDPVTGTVYVLTEVNLQFTFYRTISAQFVYYPAHNVLVIDDDLRNVRLMTPTDDKRVIYVNSLKYDEENEYRWMFSTDECLVICYQEDDKDDITFVYIYELAGGRKEKLYMNNIVTDIRFAMTPQQ